MDKRREGIMIFFFVAIGIMTFIYSYVGLRIVIPAGPDFRWNIIVTAIMLAFLALPFISIFLRMSGHHNYFIYAFTWISYLSLGFITLTFLFLAARDIFLLAAVIVSKVINAVNSIAGTDSLPVEILNPERRRFFVHTLNMGILGLTGIMTGWGIFKALSGPDIVNITIPFENLPEDLDGFRIVQISDIHAGSTLRHPYIRKVVDMVKRIDCDTIVFTGDIADGKVSNLKADVAPFAELSAPHGKFFVTGNHEYYSGVDEWTEEMRRLGFEVLINENRVIEHAGGRIIMAGVTDYEGGRFDNSHISDPEKSAEGAMPGDFRILLAHQPRSIFKAEEAGFDFILSGHTHGGQYIPWNFFVRIQQPYTSGLYTHGKSRIYVNRGTGYWGPPLRGGIPSEISVITLKKS